MPDNGGESIENVLPDREPVKCISRVISDVSKLGNTTNHPSSRPKNIVQGLQSDLREATVERGAMGNAINYEGMN